LGGWFGSIFRLVGIVRLVGISFGFFSRFGGFGLCRRLGVAVFRRFRFGLCFVSRLGQCWGYQKPQATSEACVAQGAFHAVFLPSHSKVVVAEPAPRVSTYYNL